MPRFFIDRPIFAWVIAILVMLAGILAITQLPIARYPTIAPPSVSIGAFYPGASAQSVEESVTQILEQNMDYGTGVGADYGQPAAGKTGTTEDWSDAWFCGYTPRLGTTVWVGYPKGKISMESVHGIPVSGGSYPAQIWRLFMSSAIGMLEPVEFPEPKDWPEWSDFERGQYGRSFGYYQGDDDDSDYSYVPPATTEEQAEEQEEEIPPAPPASQKPKKNPKPAPPAPTTPLPPPPTTEPPPPPPPPTTEPPPPPPTQTTPG